MQQLALRAYEPSAERLFFSAMALSVLAAVLLGFARTFFFAAWFPEYQQHAPPEPIFFWHGAVFTAWFVLAAVQPLLVAGGNLRLHRRLGGYGAVLAAAMVVFGVVAALVAARRPGGFIGVPLPPLQFLVVPLATIFLFTVFVALAIARRRDAQSHKRLMLLGSISLLEAAVARWPIDGLLAPSFVPLFSGAELLTDLFLLPLVLWDLYSRGRLHPATLWGGLALIAAQPLRILLSQTEGWLAFARWATGLLG